MENKMIMVKLYMSELIYDIENKTYLTGRSLENGDNYKAVSNMQATDDDSERNQVLRSIKSAWANVMSAVGKYSYEGNDMPDNAIDNPDTLEISLLMPSNYDTSSGSAVNASIHDYIVNYAIGEWFASTNKQDAEYYIKSSISSMQQLNIALSRRKRPQREINNYCNCCN